MTPEPEEPPARVPSAHDAGSAPDFGPGRWARLVEPLGLEPGAPVCVALSGGADSVYLLRVVAAALPRPRILAVHVDHGLRGTESAGDARFCAELCAEHGVEFQLAAAPIERDASGLEARARVARYGVLAAAARAAGIATIVTAHHADDALETLILRWLRGSEISGLPALRPRLFLDAPLVERAARPERREVLRAAGATLVVVRPLLALRRAEIRSQLTRVGATWREDSSNEDTRFARNSVRHDLLPAIAAACGPGALENLHAFGRAVAGLEASLAERARSIRLEPPRHAAARRSARTARLGGTIARAELARLEGPLARRALARLFAEETGAVPGRAALDRLLADLYAGRTGWHEIRGGWRVQLRADRLDLEPPPDRDPAVDPRQLVLPFESEEEAALGRRLPIPGCADLGDGRRIRAERLERVPASAVSHDPVRVEIAAHDLSRELRLRLPRPGDRFHPLGAPGSKPLARFLADVGVPRHDRRRIPVVLSGDEVVWVAGVRPCDRLRIRPDTRESLRLTLELGGFDGAASSAR
ncbi:MAG: tRNA lysidine(34) synthetase TilS [Planctomycetota bacterium]|nr:tRNA lysidine(34) synthetase TilS [Planctomycetota bacterium]